jgi:hypothetical protein
MTRKFLSVLLLSLLVAAPSFAAEKGGVICSPELIVINPSDTQTTDAINLADHTITSNATAATAFAGEDSFLTNVPLTFTSLKAVVDAAPGTTGGTDTRTITVQWDPPGAVTLQNSVVTGTTPSTRGSFGCTISGTATSCTAHSNRGVTVPSGSTVALRVSSVSSPSAPDAAAELGLAFCMTPSAP